MNSMVLRQALARAGRDPHRKFIWKIKDDKGNDLAHDVREDWKNNLEYPGNIKVTVIRELRAVDYAK